jgi:hypothetical protein
MTTKPIILHGVNDYYPELTEIPYQATSVDMKLVITYLAIKPQRAAIKQMAYVIFRNESANGAKGVCNNYIGMQNDSGRWPQKYDPYFKNVCFHPENLTKRMRGFLCFISWKDSIDILLDEVATRGMYIGGNVDSPYLSFTVVTTDNICRAYEDLWVYGNKNYIPTKIEVDDFTSMYTQATKLFN